MNKHFLLGMSIIFFSGLLNGAFAAPMKYSRRWKWENLWLVFSFVGTIVVPWTLALALVPHLSQVYASVPARSLLLPMAFGLVWGVAQVTFGISFRMVGVALSFAVVSGLGSLSGSMVPLLAFHAEEMFRPRGILLLLSIPFLLIGLVLYAWAGVRREKEQAAPASGSGEQKSSFAAGMAVCIFTGIFASSFNLGFAFGGDVISASLRHGAGPLSATYAVWTIVLGAGFIPNLVYCAYLLVKNRSIGLYGQSGWPREALLSLTMALMWIGAISIYGIGATLVGAFGTSMGYMLFVATSILLANAFGLFTGEWKGTSPRTRKLLFTAVGFILLAIIVLNLGGLYG
jgi:L-rhamnose-H+ transport protein